MTCYKKLMCLEFIGPSAQVEGTDRVYSFMARCVSRYRTLFVSDCHLGLPESHAKDLSDFLSSTDFDTLYIVGDLLDLWAMELHPFWPDQNTELLTAIFELAKTKNVVYILGNHDGALSRFAGCSYNRVSLIATETTYCSVNGRQFLVAHGNRFDHIVSTHARLSVLGAWANDFLFLLDRPVSWIRDLFGYKSHWSLAGAIKRGIRNKQYVDSFKALLLADAKKRGFDGVICGHLHRPAMEEVDGILYYNDGDMITSLTLLAETDAGEFQIVQIGSQT